MPRDPRQRKERTRLGETGKLPCRKQLPLGEDSFWGDDMTKDHESRVNKGNTLQTSAKHAVVFQWVVFLLAACMGATSSAYLAAGVPGVLSDLAGEGTWKSGKPSPFF